MPSTRSRETVRLSLEVSPELNQVLENLANETHTTKSDVLRKAIALMEVAVEARDNNQKLYVSDQPPAGHSREIVGI